MKYSDAAATSLLIFKEPLEVNTNEDALSFICMVLTRYVKYKYIEIIRINSVW